MPTVVVTLIVTLAFLQFAATANVLAAPPTAEQSAATDFFEEAFAEYRRNNCSKAIELFDLGLKLDPKDGKAHYYRGRCFGNLGRDGDATRAYEQAVALSPESTEGVEAGVLLQKLRDDRKAREEATPQEKRARAEQLKRAEEAKAEHERKTREAERGLFVKYFSADYCGSVPHNTIRARFRFSDDAWLNTVTISIDGNEYVAHATEKQLTLHRRVYSLALSFSSLEFVEKSGRKSVPMRGHLVAERDGRGHTFFLNDPQKLSETVRRPTSEEQFVVFGRCGS